MPLLINAVKTDDPNVCSFVLSALSSLCSVAEGQAACASADTLSILVPALKKHKTFAFVAQPGLDLLCLIVQNGEKGAASCAAAGAFTLALQVLVSSAAEFTLCAKATDLISLLIAKIDDPNTLIAIRPLVSNLRYHDPAKEALKYIARNKLGIADCFKHYIALCTVGDFDEAKELCFCLGSDLVSASTSEKGHEGENCLHIALKCNAPLSFIRELVVNSPRDCSPTRGRAESKIHRETGDESFGEYPLSLAAALGKTDAVSMLLNVGADALAQDKEGLTVMHIAVKYASLDVIRLLAMRAPELWNIASARGYCPIVFAASLDTALGTKMFENMLELRRIRKRRFANTTSWLYPLAGIDEVATADSRSAVLDKEGVLRAPKKSHSLLDMLSENNLRSSEGVCKTDFVKRLVEFKWTSYGERRIRRFRHATYIYLIALTIVALLHASPAADGAPHLLRADSLLFLSGFGQSSVCSAGDGSAWLCTSLIGAEMLVLLGAAARALLHIRRFRAWRAKRSPKSLLSDYVEHFRNSFGAAFFNIALTIFFVPAVASLAILSALGRVDSTVYHILLGFTCIMSWGSLLWFFLADRSQAEFVVSLGSMLTEDLPNYLALSAYLFAGFTSAFFVVGRYTLDELLSLAGSTFTIILDNGDDFPQPERGERYELEPFRVVFLVVVSLVLVNMLVALMGKTLDRVKDLAEVSCTRLRSHTRRLYITLTPRAQMFYLYLRKGASCSRTGSHHFGIRA